MPARQSSAKNVKNKRTVVSRTAGSKIARSSSFGADQVLPSRCAAEVLEPRTMLTTFTSTPATGPGQFVWQGANGVNELNYNDITFEAVAVNVDQTTGGISLPTDLTAAEPLDNFQYLYKIYVSSSHTDSYLTISEIDPNTGNLIPFANSIAPFQASGTTNYTGNPPYIAAVPGGTGSILIGAQQASTLFQDPPPLIESIPFQQSIGVEPAPDNGHLTPGIEIAPIDPATDLQNDMGTLAIGGTVTGSVSIGGNINTFYAGSVLTGAIQTPEIFNDPLTQTAGGALAATATSTTDQTANFTVAGDIRSFLTDGPVGTDNASPSSAPTFATNFFMTVGGALGEMHVGNTTFGAGGADLFGQVVVSHDKGISGQTPVTATPANPFPVHGLDPLLDPYAENDVETQVIGNTFANGTVHFPNTSINDAQVLGTIPVMDPISDLPTRDADGNIIYEALVAGNTQDAAPLTNLNDFYSMGFLAGQTFQVAAGGVTNLEVFDPDGRLIATNVRAATTLTQTLQLTADRPGIYTFELVGVGGQNTPNELRITTTGDLGMGGIVVTGGYSDLGFDGGISAKVGSLGLIHLFGTFISSTLGPTPQVNPLNPNVPLPVVASTTIDVEAGSLRAFVADAIGVRGAALPTAAGFNTLSGGPYLNVPVGDVGLLQSTDPLPAIGVLDVHSRFDPNYLPTLTGDQTQATHDIYKVGTPQSAAIGGAVEAINAAQTFEAELATNQGIGAIRAADMVTDAASYFDVNADNTGYDGIIDLIDITNGVGEIGPGGPAFVTNDGGDIRYMSIGGPIARDNFFGGTDINPTTYAVGQTANFTDDGGNVLTITPLGQITVSNTTSGAVNNSTNSTTTTTTVITGPQIAIMGYPIRDKGGEVPISITSSGGMNIVAKGTNGANSQVEVGTLEIQGVGRPIIAGPTDRFGNVTIEQQPASLSNSTTTITTNADGSVTTTTVSGDPTDLELNISGPATVSVLNTVSTGSAVQVINHTRGEMINVTSPSINVLYASGNLGYGQGIATAMPIMPIPQVTGFSTYPVPYSVIDGIRGNTYPFVVSHTGVVITTDAVDIWSDAGVGNIVAGGTVQSLIADKSNNPIPGEINGIVGPVEVTRILNVNIGQGIVPTGTGEVAYSGIFAYGKIGAVSNAGVPQGDIRGNLITGDSDSSLVGLDTVQLTNASIIGARISTLAPLPTAPTVWDFESTSDAVDTYAIQDSGQLQSASPYIFDIASIGITGRGGIIDAHISARDIGPITVRNGGFGIFSTNIFSQAQGRIAAITASGFGLRDDDISGGAYVGKITATGNGSTLSVLAFGSDLRPSDSQAPFDPFFQINLSATSPKNAIDINDILGTSALVPVVANVSDTAVIEDCVIQGENNFAGMQAFQIRTRLPLYNEAELPRLPNIPTIAADPEGLINFPMNVAFGEVVGQITVFDIVDGLQITAGQLLGLNLHKSVSRLGISAAGTIANLVIHGNFGQTILDESTGLQIPDSYLYLGGPSGTIKSMTVLGSLYAKVTVTGEIVSLSVIGDIEGSITAQGKSTPMSVRSLNIAGGIRDGSISLIGNVGSITIGGGLGSPTGSLTIHGSANLISVGTNHRRRDSSLQLALDVEGALKSLVVYGTITGSVLVNGDLGTLNVVDPVGGNAISGTISIAGRLLNGKVTGGDLSGSVIADNSIGSFTIANGSLASTGTVESQLSNINSFTISGGAGYGLYGTVSAVNGISLTLNVSGNIGDGTNAALVTAASGSTFRVRGSVLAHSTLTTAGSLNLLRVDGSIAAGAIITAHPLVKLKVGGTNNGSITGV